MKYLKRLRTVPSARSIQSNICDFDIQLTFHYLLHCRKFVNDKTTLLNDLSNINVDKMSHNDTTSF